MASPLANVINADIMAGIPAPPDLKLPSLSAPQSRITTPPAIKRNAISKPVSPISKRRPLLPITAKASSPDRALRRHKYHASLKTVNPRADDEVSATCPEVQYDQRNSLLRSQSCGTFFRHNPRAAESSGAPCPTHAYATIEQELAMKSQQRHAASFYRHNPRAVDTEPLCPIHSYTTIEQEIAVKPSKTVARGVPFGNTPRRLSPRRASCAVHVYAEARSTLSEMNSATFGTAGGRTSFQRTDRALAPVHAYADPQSSLRTVGGAAFGRSASRLELPFPSHLGSSRSGLTLMPSRSRPDLAPRPTALPKLNPLPEVPLSQSESKPDDAQGSPREIEATFVA